MITLVSLLYHFPLSVRHLPKLHLKPRADLRHPHMARLDQLLDEPRDLRLLQLRLQKVN